MNTLRTFISALLLSLPAAAGAQAELREVTDSQGNKYQADAKGTIYTDGSPAPLNARPHASVENIGYYYNKVGSLFGAGKKDDAIFMSTEILDLPDADKNVRKIKYAVGLTLSRMLPAESLNKLVPFVRHESQGRIIYRNRQLDLELSYPASFLSEDNYRGEPGKMTGAFVGLLVAKAEGKARPATLAVSANALKIPFDAFVQDSLTGYKEHFKQDLLPVEPPLRPGAKQYHGAYAEDGTDYQYDIIFFKHPKAKIGYLVIFVCPDKKYAELKKYYEDAVKNIKVGKIPPLKYESALPE